MTDTYLGLNYHHLLYFAAVVEEEGLVPAARRLGVSHPTVSEQVKKLEAQLGMPLFERRGRRLQLTENGTMVYEYAREMFGIGAALVEAVEARRSGRTVLARIGIDSVLAKLLVRSLLSPVMDALGDSLRLRCVEDERERLIAQLRARRLDVVLSDAPAQVLAENLQPRLLATSDIAFFASPALASALPGEFPTQLDGAPFLLPMSTTRLRREIERWMGEQNLVPRIVGDIEDSGLLKALGQEGRGVFVMPAAVSDEVQRQYEVVELGRASDVQARVFALSTPAGEANAAVRSLLASAPGPAKDSARERR